MKVIVAEYSGFCHGVKYTIDKIEILLAENGSKLYCIGLPVHNPQVTNRLIEKGLNVVSSIDEIECPGRLIVRAHGLPPAILDVAKEKGLEIVNTTCNIVVNVQRIVKDLYDDNYKILIVGEAKHPEVKAVAGVAADKGVIISDFSDLESARVRAKVGVVAQTTFSKDKYREIIKFVVENDVSELRVFNTICNSIAKRSEAAVKVARMSGVMLIIGGKMSSNTKRLYEACKSVNKNSHHIETADEFRAEWFEGVEVAGITAGASTPQWLIDDVREAVKQLPCA